MKTKSLVSRALAQPKSRRYLMGYVAAITHNKGHFSEGEILLTKTGDWSSLWYDAPKEKGSHVWPTQEQALAIARKAHSASSPAYVRAYWYETSNPENAKGMQEIVEGQDYPSIYVESETESLSS